MNFTEKLIERIPSMFILMGLALLGFGRKSSKFQEAGGQLPDPTIPIILIIIGVGILIFQSYNRKKNSQKTEMDQTAETTALN